MTSIEQADSWIGRTAVDNTGEQIGIITQIWVDDASGQPEWASVRVPVLRGRDALVPLAGTDAFGGGRRFAYSKEEIVDAPHCADDGTFAVEDKERLSAYYGAPGAADPGSATWIDRLDDAADGATVREITALLGNGATAPAPQAPAPRKLRGRIRRKAAPSAPKAKRTFRRPKAPAPDQQPAELSGHYDEDSIGH